MRKPPSRLAAERCRHAGRAPHPEFVACDTKGVPNRCDVIVWILGIGPDQVVEREEVCRQIGRDFIIHNIEGDITIQDSVILAGGKADVAIAIYACLGIEFGPDAQGAVHDHCEHRLGHHTPEGVFDLDENGAEATVLNQDVRRHLAGVAYAVAVAVGLVGVCHIGAVVAGIAATIAVGVQLVVVSDRWAIVAGVAEGVAIGVGLVGVGHTRAVVHGIADAVPVDVNYDIELQQLLVVDAHVQPIQVGLQRVAALGEGGVHAGGAPVVDQGESGFGHPLLHEARDIRACHRDTESVVAFVEDIDAGVDTVAGVDHADAVVGRVVDVECVRYGLGPETFRPDQERRQQRAPAHVHGDVDEPREGIAEDVKDYRDHVVPVHRDVLAGVGRVGNVADAPLRDAADAVEVQVLADPRVVQAYVVITDVNLELAAVLRLARQDLQGAVVDHQGCSPDRLVDADSSLGSVIGTGDHVGRHEALICLTDQGLGFVAGGDEPGGEQEQQEQQEVGFHEFLLLWVEGEGPGFHDFYSFLPSRNGQAG